MSNEKINSSGDENDFKQSGSSSCGPKIIRFDPLVIYRVWRSKVRCVFLARCICRRADACYVGFPPHDVCVPCDGLQHANCSIHTDMQKALKQRGFFPPSAACGIIKLWFQQIH